MGRTHSRRLLLGLLFQYSIEVSPNDVGGRSIHISVLNHSFGFTDRFSQEQFGFDPVFPFFVDQAEAVEAVRVIRLCKQESFESFFSCIKITSLDAIESLIPPLDIILFLKGANIRVLLSALFNVV